MPIETFYIHLKAHTISNKLVSKISAQKKGRKSYDSYNVFKFQRFEVESPLNFMYITMVLMLRFINGAQFDC